MPDDLYNDAEDARAYQVSDAGRMIFCLLCVVMALSFADWVWEVLGLGQIPIVKWGWINLLWLAGPITLPLWLAASYWQMTSPRLTVYLGTPYCAGSGRLEFTYYPIPRSYTPLEDK